MKLGEIIHKESQQQNAAASDKKNDKTNSNGSDNKKDDVVDADFEEVKPDSEKDTKSTK